MNIKRKSILLVTALLSLIWLSGCSSLPQTEEDLTAYRIDKHEEAMAGKCFFPDGMYVEAPEWVCAEQPALKAVGMYSISPAGYQHARNMAYLQAVREVARKTDEEIRSMSKSYTSVTGGGSAKFADEDVIQALVFKVANSVSVREFIVSPAQDLYVLVEVGEVGNIQLGNSQQELWQEYRAQKAHEELDAKFNEYQLRQ